ncbi:MAG: hypothetical protein OXC05_08115, partial [Halieaceae bacterium]|nr:hypothetical protein [Halieaceae bacterium]
GPEALKGGERNQVMLHVDLKTLQENSGENQCRLDHDNWLHPDSARRLSCDASLVTVLENEKGEVLNIGRRSRIIPPHIHRSTATIKMRTRVTIRFVDHISIKMADKITCGAPMNDKRPIAGLK